MLPPIKKPIGGSAGSGRLGEKSDHCLEKSGVEIRLRRFSHILRNGQKESKRNKNIRDVAVWTTARFWRGREDTRHSTFFDLDYAL